MAVEEIIETPPAVMGAELIILTSYLWNAGQLKRETEKAVNKKWKELRATVDTDKQADREVKLTSEYEEFINAKEAKDVVLETIRSIKKQLQIKSDEARNAY